MFPFKKPKDHQVVAIFDIGSTSVGGALVVLSKRKLPKIIYSVRKQMRFEEELDAKQFLTSMIRTLKNVTSDIERKGVVHLNFLKMEDKEIAQAFCFVSSPWHVSSTKIVKIKKNEPFTVSRKMINSIVKEEEDEFVNSDLDEYSELFSKKDIIELMDRKVIQIKLNGYSVNSPYNKKAKSIEASIFMSVISQNISGKISKEIQRAFHLDNIIIHSFTLPIFLDLRDIFNTEDNFVFLDVSGEITDVSFVKDGVLRETQTFPIGKNSFIREVAKKFKISRNAVMSMLRNYVEENLDEKTVLKLEKILEAKKKEWIKFLENGLVELSQGALIPRTIFIVAGQYVDQILEKAIREEPFAKLIFPGYNKTSNPILINHTKIRDFCRFGSGVDREVFLGIEAVFVNKLFNLK